MKSRTGPAGVERSRYIKILQIIDRSLRRLPTGTGPAAMLIFLVAAEYFDLGQQVGYSLAPAFVILAFSVYCGGWICGILSAGQITVYELFLWGDVPVGRIGIVIGSVWIMVFLIALLNERASLIDAQSALMDHLKKAMLSEDDNIGQLKNLLNHWADLSDTTREQTLRAVILRMADNRHDLAHLATLVFGWHAIRAEMEETMQKAEKWSKEPPR
jgi:hypothetical protein